METLVAQGNAEISKEWKKIDEEDAAALTILHKRTGNGKKQTSRDVVQYSSTPGTKSSKPRQTFFAERTNLRDVIQGCISRVNAGKSISIPPPLVAIGNSEILYIHQKTFSEEIEIEKIAERRNARRLAVRYQVFGNLRQNFVELEKRAKEESDAYVLEACRNILFMQDIDPQDRTRFVGRWKRFPAYRMKLTWSGYYEKETPNAKLLSYFKTYRAAPNSFDAHGYCHLDSEGTCEGGYPEIKSGTVFQKPPNWEVIVEKQTVSLKFKGDSGSAKILKLGPQGTLLDEGKVYYKKIKFGEW